MKEIKIDPLYKYPETLQLLLLKNLCNKIYIARNISMSSEGVEEQLKVIDTLFRDEENFN
jgi:hypothetical protein